MTESEDQRIDPYETSLDYLSGDWQIYQLKDGHRFSTDDVAVAAYAIEHLPKAPNRILDLGTGIGSVALMLAWRWPSARVVGIEAQAMSFSLGQKTRRHNKVEDRVSFIHGDFREPEIIPEPGNYDLVTGSPPYLIPEDGIISNHLQKAYCRFELRGGVEDYCRAAKGAMAPEGYFSLVFGARWIPRVFEAARETGLTITRWRRMIPRLNREPLLAVFVMRHSGIEEETKQQADLLIRGDEGKRTEAMVKLRASVGMPDKPRKRRKTL